MISQTCTWGKAEIRKVKRPAQGHPGCMQIQTRIWSLVAKAMTKLDSILKSRDISLPTKVRPRIKLKKNQNSIFLMFCSGKSQNLSIPKSASRQLWGSQFYIIRNITIKKKKKEQKSERLSNEPETTQLEKPSWHSNEVLSGLEAHHGTIVCHLSTPQRKNEVQFLAWEYPQGLIWAPKKDWHSSQEGF